MIKEICQKAHNVSFKLAGLSEQEKNVLLGKIADSIDSSRDVILKANACDLENAIKNGLTKVMQDRLKLDEKRLNAMSSGVRDIIKLPDPIGEVTAQWTLANGLNVRKVRAPLGTIGVIYEARPNVTIDVAALCLKSGNSVVLRGGKEAINSNRALHNAIKSVLGDMADAIGFIDDTSRDSTKELLLQGKYIDVVIPRGGEGLKKFILEHATMPVIASAGGNCHLYAEKTCDIDKAIDVIYNAKMSRPSVCNALEQLLVDRELAPKLLPLVSKALGKDGCTFTGSEEVIQYMDNATLATDDDYQCEHLDYVLTVQIVDSLEQAIDIINKNSTKHSDGILSKDSDKIKKFETLVDSACVYANASTRFSDGFEMGFGAEIGISTQKLHARGPMGLRQLTSEKYLIEGDGQVRK